MGTRPKCPDSAFRSLLSRRPSQIQGFQVGPLGLWPWFVVGGAFKRAGVIHVYVHVCMYTGRCMYMHVYVYTLIYFSLVFQIFPTSHCKPCCLQPIVLFAKSPDSVFVLGTRGAPFHMVVIWSVAFSRQSNKHSRNHKTHKVPRQLHLWFTSPKASAPAKVQHEEDSKPAIMKIGQFR